MTFDYAERRRRLSERLEADGVEALFLAPSADLEYLTGVERDIPNFGEAAYAHGWVTGAFFRPGADPVFVLPRMFALFDLREQPAGRGRRRDRDRRRLRRLRAGRARHRARTIAVGDRVWAETALNLGRILGFERPRAPARGSSTSCAGSSPTRSSRRWAARSTPSSRRWRRSRRSSFPASRWSSSSRRSSTSCVAAGSRCPSFTTHIFTGLGDDDFDSGTRDGARRPIPEGTSVMFDFGGVVDGYCSDFGRTIYCGEPPPTTARPTRSCSRRRKPGARPRSRGHARARGQRRVPARRSRRQGSASTSATAWATASGMDVHERPFISERGRDAAPGRHDVHRRAVDHHPRPLQPPDRGHRRVRGGRRADCSTATRPPSSRTS